MRFARLWVATTNDTNGDVGGMLNCGNYRSLNFYNLLKSKGIIEACCCFTLGPNETRIGLTGKNIEMLILIRNSLIH